MKFYSRPVSLTTVVLLHKMAHSAKSIALDATIESFPSISRDGEPKREKRGDTTLITTPQVEGKRKKPFAFHMSFLALIIMCLIVSPLTWAGVVFPWSSWKTVLPLVLGVVILVAFGWYESKPAEPLFPYRIFQNRTASVTLVASFLHGTITFSIILYAPLFFQSVYLESPLKSAISILPLCCSSVAFGILSAVAVEMIRKYRKGILVSWIFAAVGVDLSTLWDRSSLLAVKATFQVILGIGTGTLFSILIIPMQASAPHVDDMGWLLAFWSPSGFMGGS
jgi:hypothetical protein